MIVTLSCESLYLPLINLLEKSTLGTYLIFGPYSKVVAYLRVGACCIFTVLSHTIPVSLFSINKTKHTALTS